MTYKSSAKRLPVRHPKDVTGARQHFLPASYLGGFSDDQQSSPRDRLLWVRRKDQPTARQARVNSVGWENRLYDTPLNATRFGDNSTPSKTVDDAWHYESKLPGALKSLVEQEHLDAANWLHALVPFISSLFVRSRDWHTHYGSRFDGFKGSDVYEMLAGADAANNARLIEWQDLLAPVMAAEWNVLHATTPWPAVLSDLAYTFHLNPEGIAIPIRVDAVLVLCARTRSSIMRWRDGRWTATNIVHRVLGPHDMRTFGEAMWAAAGQEIYGPSEEAVQAAAESGGAGTWRPPGPSALWHLTHDDLIPFQEDYFRALTVADLGAPHEDREYIEADPAVMAKYWSSTVLYNLNVPHYPGGLTIRGTDVEIDMARLEGPRKSGILGGNSASYSTNDKKGEEFAVRGLALADNGNVEEALTAFSKWCQLEPTNSTAWHNTAAALKDLGRYDEALRAARMARDLDPSNGGMWSGLSVALALVGDNEAALAAADTAIGMDPDASDAWCNKGVALARMHQLEEAAAAFFSATVKDPSHLHAWRNLALAFSQLGQREQAVDAIRQVLKLDPCEGDLALIGASILQELGRHEEALKAYDARMRVDPSDPRPWLGKASSLADLENWQDAVAACTVATQLDSSNSDAWRVLSALLGHLDRFDEALVASQRAININPKNARAWRNMGTALQQLGRRNEAEDVIRRADELVGEEQG